MKVKPFRWPASLAIVPALAIAFSLLMAEAGRAAPGLACDPSGSCAVPGAPPSSAELVSRVNETWAGITDFESGIDIRLASPRVDFPGTVRLKGQLFRLDLEAPPALLGNPEEPGGPKRVLVISWDGRVFWQVIPMAGEVYVWKTDYRAEGAGPGSSPSAGFALPEVDYRVGEEIVDGRRLVRLETTGSLPAGEDVLFPGLSTGLPLPSAEKAVILLDPETLLPREFRLLDGRGAEVGRLSFRGPATGRGLEDSIFTPEYPAEAFVIDRPARR